MFDKSLYDAADPELVAAETAAGAELAAGVGTLDDPRANDDPQALRLRHGLWCTAFRCCGSTRPSTTTTDPIATVERVAGMLFEPE